MRVKTEELPKLTPKGKTIAELAKELKKATTARKKYEKLMEQQKSLAHLISVTFLPKLMENLEGDGVNITGIGYVELGVELYPYVKKEDEPAFFEWLRANGSGGIIKPTIHPKTLKAWVGEQIDDPEKAGLLPEILTVGKIPTAVLKAEKKKRK